MIRKAIVTTNCTDDPQWRVKVKCEGVWDKESELLPSLNSIYLEKDDVVLVMIEDIVNPIILGRFVDKAQADINPVKDGPLLFQARKEDSWIVAHLLDNEVVVTTSKGTTIKIAQEAIEINTKTYQLKASDSVQIEGGDITVKGNNVTVEGSATTVKGSTITVDGMTTFKNGFGPPDGKGPLCGLPMCLFSGSPHSASSTS